MARLLEWLLDLDSIRIDRDAPLLLKFNGHIQAWMLVCFALAAITWVVIVYRRETLSKRRRVVLATMRCAILALVIAVLCQPALVLQRNRVERSQVALLIDTSQSMATTDTYEDEAIRQTVTRGAGLEDTTDLSTTSRLDLIKTALTHGERNPLITLLRRNGVLLATFAGKMEIQGAAATAASLEGLVRLVDGLEADGRSTDLAGAVAEMLSESQGRRLAGIVLASDGQSTEPTSLRDVLDVARGRRIPIFPLRIGSTRTPLDIAVGPARAEPAVFINDLLAVEVDIAGRGLGAPTALNVSLIDDRSDTVVASAPVTLDPAVSRQTIELRIKPTQPGRFTYRAEVAAIPREQNVNNNTASVEVTVLDDRLRVLYVDGYPRYEYRYLKNALLREQTMDLSVLLIEADDQFVQEGTEPIRRFPETPEELNRFDVVLFGDVDPRGGWLTVAQMNMLLDFVGHEGGGFGLIAGERHAPQQFLGTPLQKLIPVRIDPNFHGQYDTPLTSGFRPELTPEGRASRLFRSAVESVEPAAQGDTNTANDRYVAALPELYWIARTLGPKPGAVALAVHPTLSVLSTRSGSDRMPVIVTGRYGAGRLFFQATDDTWRWRRHTGEFFHDTYWVQVARELMRGDRVAQSRRYVIRTDRRVYPYGSPVQTQVEIYDADLLAGLQGNIEIVAMQEAGRTTSASETQRPSASEPGVESFVAARFDAYRLSPGSSIYGGTFVPLQPGGYSLRPERIPPRPGEKVSTVSIRVEGPDLESRNAEADHTVLEQIAEATGGQVVELDQLASHLATIRDRSVEIPDDVTEPLWDSKLVLMLFVLMISTEWVLRKAFGVM